MFVFMFFFFKQNTAYEVRISDWSSDVCSSDLPVLLDGFICTSAIAPLAAANPAIVDHCIAGHCSAEPGHRRLLALLGLDPLLSLDMRLGEGSGAAVAANIVRSEEHTSELQSLMRISYAVFCLKIKKPQM